MKKLSILLSILFFSFITGIYAQSVGINSSGASPDASAMLDVSSTTKGFLAPRMRASQRLEILSPVAGLIVYQHTDSPVGYYYYDGSSWNQIGNATDATQWTTDGSNIYFSSGNVGIGGAADASTLLKLSATGSDSHGGMELTLSGDAGYLWGTETYAPGLSSGNNLINLIGVSGTSKNAGYIGFDYAGNGSVSNALILGLHSVDDAFRLTGAGDVGIGTSSINGRLHVSGSTLINAQKTLYIDGFGSNYAYGIYMNPRNDGDGLHYITFTNSTGSIIGSITKNGSGVLYNTTSDYRLKENIEELNIDSTINKIMSAKPVTYTWKSNGVEDVGFIAHELEEAGFTNAVSGNKDAIDNEGNIIPQCVDYGRITPEILRVVQYLLNENDILNKEIEKLKLENSKLSASIKGIEELKLEIENLKKMVGAERYAAVNEE